MFFALVYSFLIGFGQTRYQYDQTTSLYNNIKNIFPSLWCHRVISKCLMLYLFGRILLTTTWFLSSYSVMICGQVSASPMKSHLLDDRKSCILRVYKLISLSRSTYVDILLWNQKEQYIDHSKGVQLQQRACWTAVSGWGQLDSQGSGY